MISTPPSKRARARILVVDDEASARSGLEKLLRQEGYDVDVAEDGANALALFAEAPADVVVTDLKMPVMDGIELTAKLHEIDRTLPIIVASSVDEAHHIVLVDGDALALQNATAEHRALAIALRAYPVREDNAYLTVCAPFALIRLFALEFGRRLTRRGVIDEVGDVFLLYLDEARAALVDRAPRQELVAQRRARRRQVLERPGPPQYGPDPAPIPALHRLPGPARTMTEDGLWLLDLITTVPARPDPGTAGTTVSGTAAARGTARGPVRIVNDESEFDKLQAGDVLVCECTSPAWSIVFPSLAAVVTNSGGILSHPAIVAREFGIPAVVATGDATTRLQDGQIIVVDGTAGTVRVVS